MSKPAEVPVMGNVKPLHEALLGACELVEALLDVIEMRDEEIARLKKRRLWTPRLVCDDD